MRLRILVPTHVLLDMTSSKVIAEAQNGFFCLLPRHVDFVAALVPGILYLTDQQGAEHVVAVDEGTLIKCGDDVMVSVLDAAIGEELSELRKIVAQTYRQHDDDERRARTALARLEAGAMRRFLELEKQSHG